MELLAPAGSVDKLKVAYQYGADAAYIGIRNFSLRQKADNFHEQEYLELRKIKNGKKLFGAINIFFHEPDLENLRLNLDYLSNYPLDAFIVSDLGAASILRKRFPDTPLHLSTQANCLNSESVKAYQSLGFQRIIPGREATMEQLKRIKDAVPDMELEVFVHGAMCIAYSGRCLLSSEMTGRSGNHGECTHSCRWSYRVLEEGKRPGEYYPIVEGDNFTSILSSRDLCMIDHLPELKEIGVDSIKIEGRMKSLYYTAVITRAYRASLRELAGEDVDMEAYRRELHKVSHRDYSTGFYFDDNDMNRPPQEGYIRTNTFLGILGERVPREEVSRMDISSDIFSLEVKNKIQTNQEIEIIGPDLLSNSLTDYTIFDKKWNQLDEVAHGEYYFQCAQPVGTGYILRSSPSR